MENFTWIPFYKELAQKLLAYKDRQNELIDFLEDIINKKIPSIQLNDKDENGKSFKLTLIDPFTFFASFNRGITNLNRIKILNDVKVRFEIKNDIPKDFSGIPTVNNYQSWFFAYKKNRRDQDIPLLWEIFEKAILTPEDISKELFSEVLNIKCVSIVNLSMGLYWVNPERFAACDSRMRDFLKNHKLKFPQINTLDDYNNFLQRLKEDLPSKKIYEISYDAWKETSTPNDPSEIYYPSNGKNFWLYAPGIGAEMWEEFYSKGIMGIEWDILGDLKKFPDKKSITKRLQETSNIENPGSKKNDSTACDEFANKISIGDIVISKTGQNKLLGWGIVKSDYYFENETAKYKSRRKVDWRLKGIWETDFQLVQKTLTDITKYDSEHPDYKKYTDRLMAIMEGRYYKKIKDQNLQFPLNQILYGPPGTGKTYNSINHAVAIVEGKKIKEIENESQIKRENVLERFRKYMEMGLIVFTTFHQSMCYEDFIEGIKPIEPQNDNQPVTYKVIPGIFKEICDRIISKEMLTDNKLPNFHIENFDQLYSAFVSRLIEIFNNLEINEVYNFESRRSKVKLVEIDGETIVTIGEAANSTEKITKEKIKRIYDKFKSVDEIKNINNQLRGEVGGDIGWTTNYYAVFKALKDFEVSIATNDNENIPSKKNNYVIIIDEINRGNVSQIFGELITLIEKDKRLRGSEELTVTLPYSKQKGFGVPSNLYIIGTMNTADRSVEALDSALRRRFTFIEMNPEPKLVKDLGAMKNLKQEELIYPEVVDDLVKVMEVINERIEKLLDKDHMIGHSYFMSVSTIEDLKCAFQNKIIPLLQEYFYGDIAKIGLVLGIDFFEPIEINKNIFADFPHDDKSDLSDRKVYRLKKELNDEEFIIAVKKIIGK